MIRRILCALLVMLVSTGAVFAVEIIAILPFVSVQPQSSGSELERLLRQEMVGYELFQTIIVDTSYSNGYPSTNESERYTIIGERLNAARLLLGTLSRTDDSTVLEIRLFDVETKRICYLHRFAQTASGERELLHQCAAAVALQCDISIAQRQAIHKEFGMGSLFIRSQPSGARIVLDSVASGQTPRMIENLPAGSYLVSLAKPGYLIQTKMVPLKADRTENVSIVLVKSGTDTTMAIDNVLNNKTALRFSLFAGGVAGAYAACVLALHQQSPDNTVAPIVSGLLAGACFIGFSFVYFW